jgi:hypothetical protein
MITKDGKAKDGKIIEVIDKIKMANLAKMGIIKTTITRIITTEIMDIGKEGIGNVFAAKKKDIKGMIVHYGNNI